MSVKAGQAHLSGHKVEDSAADWFQLGNYRLKAGIWTGELVARTRRYT